MKTYKEFIEAYQVSEKTLTSAEKKKREEVAKAIERDNPSMPMDKKMAIATATAKRVAEAKKGLWANIHAKRKRGERPAKPGEKGYPKTLNVGEDLKQARKNVGADKCWDGYKAKGTKKKGGKEVPNCVKESEGRLKSAGVQGYNKPKRTPGHPKKSHIVVAKDGSKVKTIRFGEQGAETAGDPKKGESHRMKMKRKSFKARHRRNIAKGKMSAAYWANKVKW